MTDRTFRALTLSLLASTALASPALAQNAQPQVTGQSPAPGTNATDVTSPPVRVQKAQEGLVPDQTEIINTATKREENLQNVPISVQAIGTRRLDQLDISNYEQYTKQLPSVSFLTLQPGSTVVYMRGISAAGSGAEGNHSGPLPQVGTYLDEQPVTTIGGTLDVHIYDIARIESLSGPQGTLYGASSEAGTIRIITNKPELGVTTGRIDGELNTVRHGSQGGKLEGMINLPIASSIAFRGVAFYEHDAGYIDNIFGSRTYYAFAPNLGIDEPTSTVTNAGLVKNNFNDQNIYGGRAALKVDLNDNWTATPTFMYQNEKANGVFFYDPKLGDLKIDRFRKEVSKDRFWQAALTVQGKVANFDVTYAGAYMDRPTYGVNDYADYADVYDRLYQSYGGLAYFYYYDAAGNQVANPQQYIIGTNHFRKMSQELRFATPVGNPFRVIAGAFWQRQSNDIHQDYKIDNLAPDLSVNGSPGTLWLTQQKRVDRDYALFGEASYDVVPTVTLTAGGRLFRYDNSLVGFFGFGRNPGVGTLDEDHPLGGFPYTLKPFNGVGSSKTGVAGCFLKNGETVRQAYLNHEDISAIGFVAPVVPGSFCNDLGVFSNGQVLPKHAKGSGFTHRINAQWKPSPNVMVYATWSRGFRPGGINRRGDIGPYAPDYLTNYEVGWKTTFGPIRWNGAFYHEIWNKFQFAYLGANSFTEIHNGKDAVVDGVETDFNFIRGGWTINATGAYTDARTKGNICTVFADTSPDCSAPGDFAAAPSGTRLPVTPKLKFAGTVRYTWPVWSTVRAHVQGAVSYQSSAPSSLRTQTLLVPATSPDPTGLSDPALVCAQAHALNSLGYCNPNLFQGRIKAATLFDAFAGFDWPKWSLEAFVTNIFDERNELTRFVACGSCTRTLVVPGRPRTIGVRAGIKF
jgi:iron complex outermembrane receptor protein